MDVATVTALSALAGSVVGGLTSGLTTWINERVQTRAERLAHGLSRREELFKDFIVAASKAYGEGLMTDKPQIQELIGLFAMISRMRVLCSRRTVECAERIMLATTEAYSAPNKTILELRQIMTSGVGLDPLKDFAEAARREHEFGLAPNQ